jgi:hypothetical protein
VDYEGRDPDLDYTPDPTVVISGEDELDRMDKEREELGRSLL